MSSARQQEQVLEPSKYRMRLALLIIQFFLFGAVNLSLRGIFMKIAEKFVYRLDGDLEYEAKTFALRQKVRVWANVRRRVEFRCIATSLSPSLSVEKIRRISTPLSFITSDRRRVKIRIDVR
jgi:hypothetical protein